MEQNLDTLIEMAEANVIPQVAPTVQVEFVQADETHTDANKLNLKKLVDEAKEKGHSEIPIKLPENVKEILLSGGAVSVDDDATKEFFQNFFKLTTPQPELDEFEKQVLILKNYRNYHQQAGYPKLTPGTIVGKIDWPNCTEGKIDTFSKIGVFISQEKNINSISGTQSVVFVVDTQAHQAVVSERFRTEELFPITLEYAQSKLSADQLTMIQEIAAKYPRENLPSVSDICKVMKYIKPDFWPLHQLVNTPLAITRVIPTFKLSQPGGNAPFENDTLPTTDHVEVAYVSTCENRKGEHTIKTTQISLELLEKI